MNGIFDIIINSSKYTVFLLVSILNLNVNNQWQYNTPIRCAWLLTQHLPKTCWIHHFVISKYLVFKEYHSGFELTDSESQFAIRFVDFTTHFAIQ